MIFCLPVDRRVSQCNCLSIPVSLLTVPAGLDGSLDIADALDGHTVLVVAVDELVLKLADLVDQDAQLVRDIGNVVIAGLTPDRELLLE